MSRDFDPALPATLKVLSAAMGAGIALLAVIVVFMHLTNARAATPEALRAVKMVTAGAMVMAGVAIVLSEVLWKRLLTRGGADALERTLRGAFIARMACREGAALFGCVAALLAATTGVLRAYPAYWANLAPAALFWAYLSRHWPTEENLKAELAELFPPAP